jgi:hypothetical protein
MSQGLTILWRLGKLKPRSYYVKFSDGKVHCCQFSQMKELLKVKDTKKMEVMAQVPTYDEYCSLEIGNEHMAKTYNGLIEKNNYLIKENTEKKEDLVNFTQEIISLDEQLKEANDILKNIVCSSENEQLVVIDYLNKWNVNNRKK